MIGTNIKPVTVVIFQLENIFRSNIKLNQKVNLGAHNVTDLLFEMENIAEISLKNKNP